jgi:hypothetical protein
MKMGHHAKMIKALTGPVDQMGPNVRALYERFLSQKDEECIAAESQVVMLFGSALNRDKNNLPYQGSYEKPTG